ncbi:hypothetical protein DFH11DRAFT_256283 [Phellopilus nigrolimitatus]|nr:hypothetical protein DFH11DRAFT_256283 [Phellopilus nigrolimitatus]
MLLGDKRDVCVSHEIVSLPFSILASSFSRLRIPLFTISFPSVVRPLQNTRALLFACLVCCMPAVYFSILLLAPGAHTLVIIYLLTLTLPLSYSACTDYSDTDAFILGFMLIRLTGEFKTEFKVM